MNISKLRFFLIIVFVLSFLQAKFTPLVDDEAYYWLWSKKLAFGYFDHPPMIAWLIAIGKIFFSDELSVRLFTVILQTISAFLFWKITNPKTEFQKYLVFVLFSGAVMLQVFGFIATPDSPLLFFTFFYLFCLQKFYNQLSKYVFVVLGVAIAGLMYSKYHGLLVILFTLLPNLIYFLKRKDFYLSVLIALILYSPHFVWLYDHDFVTLNYHLVERNQTTFKLNHFLILILGGFTLGTLGLSFLFWRKFFRFHSKDLFDRSIYYLSFLPILFFVLMSFKNQPQIQWLLIAFVAQIILFYKFYQDTNSSQIIRIGLFNIFLILVARLIIVFPQTSFLYNNKVAAKNLGQNINDSVVVFEKYQEASLFSFYNHQEAIVFRTLGNRKSQFDLWKTDRKLTHQNFVYVTKWAKTNDSILGWKNDYYFINKMNAINIEDDFWFDFEENELLVENDEEIKIKVNYKNPTNSLSSEKTKIFLIETQDYQYNIVNQIEISKDNFKQTKNKEIKEFVINYQVNKECKLYIGVKLSDMPIRYYSNGLLIELIY